MNQEKLKNFQQLCREELINSYDKNPHEYYFPREQLTTIAEKMCSAITAGTFNKDSTTFKRVCKRLGIKHTYTAINQYIER